jgi:hypothetical protein
VGNHQQLLSSFPVISMTFAMKFVMHFTDTLGRAS